MLSLCRDGRDTIEGRRADSVKDLRPRFTRTDIHAGQGRSQRPSDVVVIAVLATLPSGRPIPSRTGRPSPEPTT